MSGHDKYQAFAQLCFGHSEIEFVHRRRHGAVHVAIDAVEVANRVGVEIVSGDGG